jgi:hypothetical protein
MKGVDERRTRYGAKVCVLFGNHGAEAYAVGIREFLRKTDKIPEDCLQHQHLTRDRLADFEKAKIWFDES